jgi:hypothetical protein
MRFVRVVRSPHRCRGGCPQPQLSPSAAIPGPDPARENTRIHNQKAKELASCLASSLLLLNLTDADHGLGCGLGRGLGVGVVLGVTVGVALGVILGVVVGVGLGVILGVTVGVALGVTVGVGVTLGVTVGVGVGVPHGTDAVRHRPELTGGLCPPLGSHPY